jgi:hypothetical protein
MKAANIAPAYACLYPGLCEIARSLGYALAIHGSMASDLDLIACPWADEVSPPEALVKKLMEHIGACSYPELLRRAGVPEEDIAGFVAKKNQGKDPELKPHGRKAWNLYLDHGCRIDLSIMPKDPA